ncbi:MAG: hypothetical protein CL674_04930 [Bdellovibrionaceae bacterium]|nr:hypothetical protein [Pseudobdellovibrionaceae bacterium]
MDKRRPSLIFLGRILKMKDDFLEDEPIKYIEERRLVTTLISLKAPRFAYFRSAYFCFFIILVTFAYWKNFLGLADQMAVSQDRLLQHSEYWRMFTATLIHSNTGHLLSNLPLLFIFGTFLYAYFGVWLFPVLSFVLAGFVNLFTVLAYPSTSFLLGASGMVYLVGGLWLGLYWNIQRQYNHFQRSVRVFGVTLILFFPTSFEPQVSYRAHFYGLIAGVILGFIYFYKKKDYIRSFERYKVQYVEELPVFH